MDKITRHNQTQTNENLDKTSALIYLYKRDICTNKYNLKIGSLKNE